MAEAAGKRILVIDDANLVRRFYRDALERAGFEVDEALNGVEALEKVLGETYDLVIVDVNMPQMDGLTFLKVRAAGANFYLVKPVGQDRLVEHVSIMCGLPT
jgi:two-component system, chemotaxis family, chemotaxis protein CheY